MAHFISPTEESCWKRERGEGRITKDTLPHSLLLFAVALQAIVIVVVVAVDVVATEPVLYIAAISAAGAFFCVIANGCQLWAPLCCMMATEGMQHVMQCTRNVRQLNRICGFIFGLPLAITITYLTNKSAKEDDAKILQPASNYVVSSSCQLHLCRSESIGEFPCNVAYAIIIFKSFPENSCNCNLNCNCCWPVAWRLMCCLSAAAVWLENHKLSREILAMHATDGAASCRQKK